MTRLLFLSLVFSFQASCSPGSESASGGDGDSDPAGDGDGDVGGDGDTGGDGDEFVGTGGGTGEDISYFVEQIRLAEGLCLPRELATDSSGFITCELLEVQMSGSCDRNGFQEPPAAATQRVLDAIEEQGRCGGQTGLLCTEFSVCEFTQLGGAARDACVSDPKDPSEFATPGFCYVDEPSSAVIADCPATEKRMIRVVGEGVLTEGAIHFVACGG